MSYSVRDGAPYLCVSRTHAEMLRHAVAANVTDIDPLAGIVELWVEWGDRPRDGSSLCVRMEGTVIAQAEVSLLAAEPPRRLRVDIRRAVIGVPLVAELRWLGGSRHLHVLPRLPPRCLSFASLLSLPPPPPPCESLPPPTPPLALSAVEATPATAVMPPGVTGVLAAWRSLLPAALWPSSARASARDPKRASGLPALPTCTINRGFGVELELATDAAGRSGGGSGTALTGSGRLRAALQAAAACEEARLIERCSQWVVGDEFALKPSDVAAAELALREYEAERVRRHGVGLSADEKATLHRLLSLGSRVHKSEFRSPKPPYELSFARGAAAELACFGRVLCRMGAAAAIGVSADFLSGTAAHVHVNVCHPGATGAPLSTYELLLVYISWVQFDLCTTRLARPWLWREPWSAPLYATGPELPDPVGVADRDLDRDPELPDPVGVADRDLDRDPELPDPVGVADRDPDRDPELPDPVRVAGGGDGAAGGDGAVGGDGAGVGGSVSSRERASGDVSAAVGAADSAADGPGRVSDDHLNRSARWAMRDDEAGALLSDVPSFLAAVHALVQQEDYALLDEAGRREAVFTAHSVCLGRTGSLNVQRVCSYGTLEFRRFQSTLDGGALAHWAAFCVAFVETFREPRAASVAVALLASPSFADGLTGLQRAQERAMLGQLTALMAPRLSESSICYLLRDAIAMDSDECL